MSEGPRGLILQGAPGGAGPALGGQVLTAVLKTPPPPALLIQGQCPLQPGPRRWLWGEVCCLSLWVFIADLCWNVQRDHWALLGAGTVVGGWGPWAGGQVFVCVWKLPLEHSAFRLQMPVDTGLLGSRLRAPQAGRLGWHSPGASPHQRRQPGPLRRRLLWAAAMPSVRDVQSGVPGEAE